MKIKRLLLSCAIVMCTQYWLKAAAGIYDSFAIVEGSFYDLGATTANPDYQDAFLGFFGGTDQLLLGGQLKSFKNNESDVTGAAIFYAIYPQGNRPANPQFTQIAYGFQWNQGEMGAPAGLNNPGDQQWGTNVEGQNTTNGAQDVLAGLSLGIGTYILEVYARITTNGVDASSEIFDSRGGANYTATFEIDAPLPVTLTSFTATLRGSANQLQWATATELNNEGFEVQRSTDRRAWEAIGWVAGHGTTQQPRQYAFLDGQPLSGLSYYRLRQVDYDGQYEYSPVVSLRRGGQAEFEVFPNPAQGAVSVRFSEPLPRGQLQLMDAQGRLLQSWPANEARQLQLSAQPAGSYTLQWRDERGTLLGAQRVLLRQ